MAKTNAAPLAEEMGSEVANRRQDPFEQHYLGVLRTNDPLLLEKSGGDAGLYLDLKRDGKVKSGLQKRTLALVSRPWAVEAIDASKTQDAETLTAILKGFAFDRLWADLHDALIPGWSPVEVVWQVNALGQIVPLHCVRRKRKRFVYVMDDSGQAVLRMLTRNNMLTGVELPERKFIVHRFDPEDDNPYGTGLGLVLYWPVFFKRKGIISWNKLCDRLGVPTPWGKHARNAQPKEKATLFEALKAISNDGVIMTPEGTAIELIESKMTGSVTTQQALCEYMDDWIMEVLTGQEPRGNAGGAVASASKERQDVRLDLVQADSDLIAETLNGTLIKWICELNNLAPCMVYRPIKDGVDPKAESEADVNVASMGFKLSLAAVRSKYGEGWEVAPAVVSPAGAGAGPGAPASFAEAGGAGPDGIDAVVNAALGDWQEVLTPLVDPLQAALTASLAAGETAGEFLARLPALLEQMNPDALQAGLIKAAFVARLAGTAGLQNG